MKNTLTAIWVFFLWIGSLAIIGLWGKGVFHSIKKHSDWDAVASFFPPWGIYRGVESFWHKEITNADEINWDKRIPTDVVTAFELISYSDDKDDLDNLNIQIEKFSKKIADYPADKRNKIKEGVLIYLKYNLSATNDNVSFLQRFKNDTASKFKFSDLTNRYYDSIERFYPSAEMVAIKSAMDSLLPIEISNMKTLRTMDIQNVIEKSQNTNLKYLYRYQFAYKKIFNEDYH